jgi:Amt family ammonium transporter
MDPLIGLALVALLVRVGHALLSTGLSRSKNASSAIVRSFCDLIVTSLAFAVIGAALFWQTQTPIIGVQWKFILGGSPGGPELLFQTVAILTATSVIAGALAERARIMPVLAASGLCAGVLLPIAGNWVWYGWLRRAGFVDIAGAAALQVPAGLCAAVGTMVIGPRTGKYNRDGSTSVIPGHQLPLAAIGTLLTLIGWIAYVVGSAVLRLESTDNAAADVFFAAMAAGAAALVYSHLRYGKLDLLLTLMGMLGGLVAASAGAGAGAIGIRTAILIGACAGVLVPWTAIAIDVYLHVDDPVGLIAPQLAGGIWGTLATAAFVGGTPGERLRQLAIAAMGLLSIGLLSIAFSAAVFYGLKHLSRIRAREADEFDGLDLAEHDIGSYPDFQQNTIRSYHLREA